MYNCSETMLLVDRIELVGRVFPHESKKGVWRRFLSSLKGREIMPVRGAAYVITVPKNDFQISNIIQCFRFQRTKCQVIQIS